MQNDGRNPPTYPIASVNNALTLMSLMGERGHVRVSEAAEVLGTARSTAHRLLAMLEYHGFAQQDDETKAYTAGPELIKVGLSAAGDGLDLRGLARPVLERVRDEVDETVHLVRLQETLVVFLDSVETDKGLRVGSRVGRYMPAHCTACGKAILAELPADEVRRLYDGASLEGMTPRSLSSLEALKAELDAVRRRGYATNFGESEEDVAAVAVAVPGRPGMRRAAITVSAPLTRMDEARAAEVAAIVARAAGGLSGARSS